MHKNKIDTAAIVMRYRTWASITIAAIVLLILAGGIVRMTGSGMGCPDWPQCFGQWIPPTDISELPADYKTRYEVAGREIADFDPFKTWIEYINRLLGVLVGIFSIATAYFSLRLRKFMPSVFALSLLGLFLVIVEGGIGAYVVRTHLQTGMVTLHMIVAMAILAVFLSAILMAYKSDIREKSSLKIPARLRGIASLLLLISFIQIVLGTQVRESIDVIATDLGEAARNDWIAQLGISYDVHSLGYYAVLAVFLVLSIRLNAYYTAYPQIKNLIIAIGGIMLLEVLLGLGMHHLGIPALLQPLHLLLASLLFGAEFLLTGILWMLSSTPVATENIVYDRKRNEEVFSH